ncbi:diacylglycerol O-acyltransferase 2 [Cyclospora cayetanensis]|uniref:diacylglycerol O-acyltransferase n=1 Tax=Cyclospora cayetanensis TaxID=88456 RepID=A0A6P6RQS2_9EIME|nr:diacylglycerol O-acyltransferase 2 [Cyclospora cayetanensis]
MRKQLNEVAAMLTGISGLAIRGAEDGEGHTEQNESEGGGNATTKTAAPQRQQKTVYTHGGRVHTACLRMQHGVLSMSCTLAWGVRSDWEWLDIRRVLPGLNIRLTTLSINMRLPFWGHLLQAVGGPGRAVLVVVGGAKEAFLGGPRLNDLVLHRRKGFFEIALQTGSWLIPVYSLGENDMYERLTEGMLSCFLTFISRKTMGLFGFSLPPCYGRGVLQVTMPRRVKIVELIGNPVPCRRIPHPTQEDIEELRQRYCAALQRVYTKARAIYGTESKFEDLRIVE